MLMKNHNQNDGHTNSVDWEAECIIRLCSSGSTLVSNVTFLEKVGFGNLLPSLSLFFCWANSNLLRHQRGDDIGIKVYILSVHPVTFEISVHISISVSTDHQIVKCKITGKRSFCSLSETRAGSAASVTKLFLGEQEELPLPFPEEMLFLLFLFLFYYEKQG